MNILVTGSSGFVGQHLLPLLASHRVTGTVGKSSARDMRSKFPGVDFVAMDLQDAAAMERTVAQVKPDACFHLAGVASVDVFHQRVAESFRINAEGCLHLLEAFRKHAPAARLLLISSAQVYGAVPRENMPLRETARLNPDNFYAVSKASCEGLAKCYARNYGMPIVTMRPFNHIGPGQSASFVCSSLARQIAALPADADGTTLQAGNLQSERDFTDVRDIVRAYVLALEKGRPGEVYNVCSGKVVSIEKVFQRMLELSGIKTPVAIEHTHRRSMDIPLFFGSCEKLNRVTGWAPSIPLDQTLRDTLNYWKEERRHASV